MQEATRESQVCLLPRRRGVCEPSLTVLYLPRVSKEALRSIIISQRLLGTREIAVFHHTGCGMLTFDTPQLRKLVKDSDPSNPALSAVDEIDFHEENKPDVKVLLSAADRRTGTYSVNRERMRTFITNLSHSLTVVLSETATLPCKKSLAQRFERQSRRSSALSYV